MIIYDAKIRLISCLLKRYTSFSLKLYLLHVTKMNIFCRFLLLLQIASTLAFATSILEEKTDPERQRILNWIQPSSKRPCHLDQLLKSTFVPAQLDRTVMMSSTFQRRKLLTQQSKGLPYNHYRFSLKH